MLWLVENLEFEIRLPGGNDEKKHETIADSEL